MSSSRKKVISEMIENNFNVLKMIFSTQEGKYWLENEKIEYIPMSF